jgi:hypothetical protein
MAEAPATRYALSGDADLRFVERGEHGLKGVPGKWRLYAATAA